MSIRTGAERSLQRTAQSAPFGPGAVFLVPGDEFLEAVAEFDLGGPVEFFAGLGDVGPGGGHVGGMPGAVIDLSFFAGEFLDEGDHGRELERLVRAKVEDVVADGAQGGDGAAGDVVDVGEVARLGTVTIDGDLAAFANALGEAEGSHVGATGGAVDGEVAEDADVEAVQKVIGVGHGLGVFFGRGVGGELAVGVHVLAIGRGMALAVEARGRGEHEFPDVEVAAHFEDVERAFDIGLYVDGGILDGGADAGAGGEVDDGVEGCAIFSAWACFSKRRLRAPLLVRSRRWSSRLSIFSSSAQRQSLRRIS